MVDPRRVLSYEDVLNRLNNPQKVIIDVRNPEEVQSTGKIPSSINIPLNTVDSVLNSMSDEEFERQYNRTKPRSSDEIIFYCQSGRRSTQALDKALKLGYAKPNFKSKDPRRIQFEATRKPIWAVGMSGQANKSDVLFAL